MGIGQLRVDRQRPAEGGKRLIGALQGVQHHPALVVAFAVAGGVLRCEGTGGLAMGQGLMRLAPLAQPSRQVAVGVEMIGVYGERGAVAHRCLIRIAQGREGEA